MSVQEDRLSLRYSRRFARLPHDTLVERVARDWRVDISPYRAIELLLPEIERGAFLAHGRYGNRCCATLTRDDELPRQWPNAVSGWGKVPAQALQDLAFRFLVLMKGSWNPATHAKLVSEIVP